MPRRTLITPPLFARRPHGHPAPTLDAGEAAAKSIVARGDRPTCRELSRALDVSVPKAKACRLALIAAGRWPGDTDRRGWRRAIDPPGRFASRRAQK